MESLIQGAGKLDRLKGGVKQGFVKGNIDDIFGSLAKEGKQIDSNCFELSDGTIITKYSSSTNGVQTIGVNQGGQLYKIRIE